MLVGYGKFMSNQQHPKPCHLLHYQDIVEVFLLRWEEQSVCFTSCVQAMLWVGIGEVRSLVLLAETLQDKKPGAS